MTFLFIIYYFVTQTSLAYGSLNVGEELSKAAGNLTALKTEIVSSWVVGPQFRGTSDILWSCIVTLTACIYTAIHLNVPPARKGNWHFIWRKTKWVCLALFAPELVLYCAYRQFSEARKLVKELNDLREGTRGEGVRGKTQEVSKEPAQDEEHLPGNLNSSIIDEEKGKVGFPVMVLELPLIWKHRIMKRAYIRKNFP